MPWQQELRQIGIELSAGELPCRDSEAAAEPGEVLVSTATMQLTRRRIEYGDARLLDLKGVSAPVAAYPALGVTDQVGERWESLREVTPLIGRERELA